MAYDRSNFDSEYLCPHCGDLLYVEHTTPPIDVCLNAGCPLWPNGLDSIIDVTQSAQPRLYRDLQDSENRIIAEITKWKPGALTRYAYKARRELITMLFRTRVMPSVDYFFATGELLLLTNKHHSQGTVDSLEEFRGLLEATRRWSLDQRNLEDLRTKRYVLGRTPSGIKRFFIKFAEAVSESQKGRGLVSYRERSPLSLCLHTANLKLLPPQVLTLARSLTGQRSWGHSGR